MKNLKTKILTLALTATPVLAFGAPPPLIRGGGVEGSNITSVDQIIGVLNKVVNYLGGIFFTVAVVMIFYAAFLYLTAAGEPEKLTKAKNQLIYAIIAIAVGLIAFSVTTITKNFIQ